MPTRPQAIADHVGDALRAGRFSLRLDLDNLQSMGFRWDTGNLVETGRSADAELGGWLPPGDYVNEISSITIAIVATDANLSKAQLKRLAVVAQDGIARGEVGALGVG